jgi:hypothetical protein
MSSREALPATQSASEQFVTPPFEDNELRQTLPLDCLNQTLAGSVEIRDVFGSLFVLMPLLKEQFRLLG